jgi:hypothetical protein
MRGIWCLWGILAVDSRNERGFLHAGNCGEITTRFEMSFVRLHPEDFIQQSVEIAFGGIQSGMY